ncbi:MAG: bifunctional 5,10-methylenetetrahydrofolate dehydrogenase/5,10-methenyltetrahydrofolate cyclohydrolase [Proteobacteria bacterium]|nr:bifunctional 5,10-methylenetetrahydrofolate dehydrogenase/5,10-methenyltetrahydrofolate cyclohydrolase [Pseudomonadota bacterium]
MNAKYLEGKPVAEDVMVKIKGKVSELKKKNIVPGLGTILVGDDSASVGYVRKKHETCQSAGIKSFHIDVPADGNQADLLAAVSRFNENSEINGFLIQYPVPQGFDFNEAVMKMNPEKDADGLHPINLGKLVLQEDGPLPCTPAGILAILRHYGIQVGGRELVIVGRGPTLGRPLSLLLSAKKEGANAAVTVVHSAVKNIPDYTRRADILICAVGIPGFIKPDMVKPGAAVVSGGISWEGKRLLPDVDETVGEVAAWITPRLGGVGPTTIAMLLKNTINAVGKATNQ